jgi:hypothetical protein
VVCASDVTHVVTEDEAKAFSHVLGVPLVSTEVLRSDCDATPIWPRVRVAAASSSIQTPVYRYDGIVVEIDHLNSCSPTNSWRLPQCDRRASS